MLGCVFCFYTSFERTYVGGYLSHFSHAYKFLGFFWWGGRGNLGVSSKEARLHVACWWRILWPCNDIPPKRNKVYVQHTSDSYSIEESIDKYIFYSFWAWYKNYASSRRAWLWKFTSVRKNLKITLQWNVLLVATPLSGKHPFTVKNWSLVTARKRSLRRLCFYTCLSFILFTGGGGVVSQHAMGQQYIRSCISVESQLVWRQHTGNIKCMMG